MKKMSTDVDQAYFTWSQEQMTQRDGSTGVSVSQMLDHGSVSFGKFEFESLSWEKWSVFTHDRRQEELEKFNGLVAEKKAYFEEYYKKLRALKALQQQEEQREQAAHRIRSENLRTEIVLEYSVDGSISDEEEEKKVEMECEMEVKEEMKEEREEIEVKEENKEEKGRLEVKKPTDRRAVVTKGASSSTSARPQKTLNPKPKPETRPASRNPKPATRPATRKTTPPPPPPPQKSVRKVNPVKPKEPSRTFPSSSTTITRATRTPVPNSNTNTSTNLKRASTKTSINTNTNTNASAKLKRPSSSGGVRRPVSASGAWPIVPARRPLSSAGVREKESKVMTEKAPQKPTRVGGPSLLNTPRIAIIPSTVKSNTSNTMEMKRETRKVVKEPLALNNNTTSVKRAPVYSLETSKSQSINLPPQKSADSTTKVGLDKDKAQALVNVVRNNSQPAPACNNASMRNATTSHAVTNNRIESHKTIAPRTSTTERPRTGTRPQTNNSVKSNSTVNNARKPRAEAHKWR